ANTIFISSHIGPDPDAVSSSLLLAEILRKNYPDKAIHHILEEHPNSDLRFLHRFETISFRPALQALKEVKPDLFIVTDANNFDRVSRTQGAEIREYVKA